MKKLITGITIGTVVATALLMFLHRSCPSDVILSLAVTSGTICYHFSMRLLTGLLFNSFMKNRTDYRRPWYEQKPWEASLYERLRVKAWKGRIPAYDPGLFDPRMHSWDKIAQAMCQAELVHETIVVLSFLPIAASVWFGETGVFIVTSVLAAGMDMVFVIVQRYNRPRIIRIIEREKRRCFE